MRSVFITGAATGIGRATARLLDAQGWRVFAGVLPGQETTPLCKGASPHLTPIEIDITKDDLVGRAVQQVEAGVGEGGLSALINNAGVADLAAGPLEGISLGEMRALFEINVFGTLRVTQRFLPLLHRAQGARIVNLSSGAVRVPVPMAGAYMMSKLAIDGLTRTLRIELAPFGIEVCAIEPGGVRTPMTADARESIERDWAKMPEGIRQRYRPLLSPANERLLDELEHANPPERIAAGILHALMAKNPRPRYTIGKDVRFLPLAQRLLSERKFEEILLRRFGIARGKGRRQGEEEV